MKLLDMQGRIYSAAQARKVAEQLQDADPIWHYIVDFGTETKFARVSVYDENYEFVGHF